MTLVSEQPSVFFVPAGGVFTGEMNILRVSSIFPLYYVYCVKVSVCGEGNRTPQ